MHRTSLMQAQKFQAFAQDVLAVWMIVKGARRSRNSCAVTSALFIEWPHNSTRHLSNLLNAVMLKWAYFHIKCSANSNFTSLMNRFKQNLVFFPAVNVLMFLYCYMLCVWHLGVEMEVIDICSVNNGGCAHECKQSASEPICFCHKGYRLLADGRSCEGLCQSKVLGISAS